ncbi:MAG: helix-turn-helix transcriptional regulator [Clostridia bacterium]|nr:helix-turn-helix transcriptional regulator [Clostridia bacterium]
MSILSIGVLPKGSTRIEPHTHDVSEITLITEGEGTVISENKNAHTVNTVQHAFHPGSIIIIPPNVPHQSYSDGGYREIFIQTDQTVPFTDSANRDIIVLEDDNENAISVMMQMMFYRYIKGEKNDPTLSLMLELVLRLLSEKYTALQRDPVIEDVRRLLALHYNDTQLSLSALLESTGYNKDHIRRRFVAVCGITPSAYLTSLKIEHAKRLLRSKTRLQLSVADIGEMCGYTDPHYFSRVFKKETGLTPEGFAAQPAE